MLCSALQVSKIWDLALAATGGDARSGLVNDGMVSFGGLEAAVDTALDVRRAYRRLYYPALH